MARKQKMTAEGAELLEAVKEMKAGKKGRVYTPEQLLAISARRSVNLTQKEFARLLNVSVDSVQDWEQGRRSPRGVLPVQARRIRCFVSFMSTRRFWCDWQSNGCHRDAIGSSFIVVLTFPVMLLMADDYALSVIRQPVPVPSGELRSNSAR